MEADWSVALAEDDPTIDIPWDYFVDLRGNLSLVEKIAEAKASLPLRSALLELNSAESPFWTAKCDVWTGNGDPYDPYEMDAELGETAFGAGSYIDLLARDFKAYTSFAHQEQWLRRVTEQLRAVAAVSVRVDLVLRHAEVDGQPGFGLSWFVEGCGSTAERAELMWATAFHLALPLMIETFRDGTITARASSSIG